METQSKTTEQTGLERLKEVCEAATPGPWGFIREKDRWGLRKEGEDTYYDIVSFAQNEADDVCRVFSGSDCDFISTARAVLPALIDYCESLERLAAMVEWAKTIGWLEEEGYKPYHFEQVREFDSNFAAAKTAAKAALARLEDTCKR